MSEGKPKRCALYRHYDENGLLLYVGISATIVDRGKAHAAKSAWVQYATRAEAQWLPDRDRALEAEEAAIKTEKPIFNLQYNDTAKARARRDAYLEARAAGRQFAEVEEMARREREARRSRLVLKVLTAFGAICSAPFTAHQVWIEQDAFGSYNALDGVCMALFFTIMPFAIIQSSYDRGQQRMGWTAKLSLLVLAGLFTLGTGQYLADSKTPSPWSGAVIMTLLFSCGPLLLAIYMIEKNRDREPAIEEPAEPVEAET